MIITLALTLSLLLVLVLTRRAMEPACPGCASKSWAAHSTQLNCTHCGWSNGVRPARQEPQPEPLHEMVWGREGLGTGD